ncbi:glycyl-radical enzyme activating protein [Enterococcus sp. BWR-S5]|uniref:glycyl-radical enzyme activating protein n=1 Tax=Enterococcus sp. BWR-S5 TaxID=2787714 RepID=UPI001924DFED|nr:glycyl-radical enzyme activating protein [Enterococcus sp. BWR-S5]MBL1226422.1 glycyl-radical enzyme activating protein [Enterococcus sp. BWR-S5]
MDKGLVFNIQRYSIHDGGGIRTIIFLKGCPLACPWCSNPESRKGVQPSSWQKNGRTETIGEWYDVDTLVDEAMKDEIFYRTSGGGVTLSGGEVLMQADFAAKLLEELHELGIHTAIETTGCFPIERLSKLLPHLDQILFDLKIMDEDMSKRVIGADVTTVKENFEAALAAEAVDVIPRIPLIPSYTDSRDNLLSIIEYLKQLGVLSVHLLPFHQYGSNKYDYLGWDYEMEDTAVLSKREISAIKELFEAEGINASVDGLE